MHSCVHVRMYPCMCVHVCVHVSMHVCVHVRMWLCLCIIICITDCVHVCEWSCAMEYDIFFTDCVSC